MSQKRKNRTYKDTLACCYHQNTRRVIINGVYSIYHCIVCGAKVMSQKQNKTKPSEDEDLFQNAFHRWLENNGITIGTLNNASRTFNCTLDINKLKIGLIERDAHRDKLIEARARRDELHRRKRAKVSVEKVYSQSSQYNLSPVATLMAVVGDDIDERIAELEAEIKRLEGEGE